MDLVTLLEEGVEPAYFERIFQVERYILLSLSYDMTAILNLDGQFEDVNEKWKKSVGYKSSELSGSFIVEYVHFDDRERVFFEMQRLITSDIETRNLSFRFLCKDGEYKKLNWNVVFSPLHNSYYCVVKDTTEAFTGASADATRDVLTGLYNRLYLNENFSQIVDQSGDDLTGVMFIDLDGFKAVNDNFGHKIGDVLLYEVANRIVRCLRKTDVVSRIGGDEFVIVLTGVKEKTNLAMVASRIIESINRVFVIDEHELRIGLSIGICFYPGDGDNAEVLLEKADKAMYRVKQSGKNNFAFAS